VTIHYTVNGQAPTVASPVYAGPYSGGCYYCNSELLAVSSAPGIALPSMIETNTYFINETSNYNVVSICGNYVGAGALFNNSQPTFSSFEYFTPLGTQILELEGGRGSRHGNDSWAFPQKGIDFEAMDESGDKGSFYNRLFRNLFKRYI
jgi:hypothetical protein